jgi:hypothetical protein
VGGEKKLRRSESERFTSNLPQECAEANQLSENSTFLIFIFSGRAVAGNIVIRLFNMVYAPNSVFGVVYDTTMVLPSSIFQ